MCRGGSGVCAGRCGVFFFSSRRRHTRFDCDWSSDVCSSDLQLQAPPFVMFPIRVQLKPGAQIPVFTYKTSTQQYARTDLFAYADESGRTVSAEIREFGTYVVGLPRDQIQSTIALNPKSGVTGTIVSLSGDGFSANPTEDLVTFAGSTSPSVAAKIIAASPT